MTLEAVGINRVGAVVVNRHRQEVILDVRPAELFAAADKATRFELVAGANTGAVKHPLRTDFRLIPPLQSRID